MSILLPHFDPSIASAIKKRLFPPWRDMLSGYWYCAGIVAHYSLFWKPAVFTHTQPAGTVCRGTNILLHAWTHADDTLLLCGHDWIVLHLLLYGKHLELSIKAENVIAVNVYRWWWLKLTEVSEQLCHSEAGLQVRESFSLVSKLVWRIELFCVPGRHPSGVHQKHQEDQNCHPVAKRSGDRHHKWQGERNLAASLHDLMN